MAWYCSSLLENSWPVFIHTVASVSCALSPHSGTPVCILPFLSMSFLYSLLYFCSFLCASVRIFPSHLAAHKPLLLCPVGWWTRLLNFWIFSIHFLVIKLAFDSFSRCRFSCDILPVFITWSYLYGTISGFYNLLHHLFSVHDYYSPFFPIYFLVAYKILVPWPGIRLVPLCWRHRVLTTGPPGNSPTWSWIL